MEYIFSVEEATQKLLTRLSESTGCKYLKSQCCIKKTVKDLAFQINFSHQNGMFQMRGLK